MEENEFKELTVEQTEVIKKKVLSLKKEKQGTGDFFEPGREASDPRARGKLRQPPQKRADFALWTL